MAVRPSLNHKPMAKPADPVATATASPVSAAEPRPKARSMVEGYRPPSRQGKRAAVAWLEPEAIKQLNLHAIQYDRNCTGHSGRGDQRLVCERGAPAF